MGVDIFLGRPDDSGNWRDEVELACVVATFAAWGRDLV